MNERKKAAGKARDEATQTAEKAYNKAVRPIWEVRKDSLAAAWKAYHEAILQIEKEETKRA